MSNEQKKRLFASLEVIVEKANEGALEAALEALPRDAFYVQNTWNVANRYEADKGYIVSIRKDGEAEAGWSRCEPEHAEAVAWGVEGDGWEPDFACGNAIMLGDTDIAAKVKAWFEERANEVAALLQEDEDEDE